MTLGSGIWWELGTWCVVACAVLAVTFTFRFGLFVPWYRSFAGCVAFSFGCVMVLAFTLTVLSLMVPLPVSVRLWARLAIFGGCAAILAAMNIGLHLAQRRGRNIQPIPTRTESLRHERD